MSHTALSTSIEAIPTSFDDDEFLITRCCLGEEAAFVAVYKKYAPSIFRLCFGFLQHREDAEEVVQDTFEYAFRKIDRYQVKKASFKTWLYQIAISRCRNKRRRKFLDTFSLNRLFGETVRDPSQSVPLDIAINNEEQEEVWKALQELSPKVRETVYLRYYEGLTYRDIGVLLGIPAKTAESRMRLAHASLRKLLGKG